MITLTGVSRFRMGAELPSEGLPYRRAQISWTGFERDIGLAEAVLCKLFDFHVMCMSCVHVVSSMIYLNNYSLLDPIRSPRPKAQPWLRSKAQD